MSDFQIIYQDHLVTVLFGDDVVGHVVRVQEGYKPFLFNEDVGVFEELPLEQTHRIGVLRLQEWWDARFREVA